MNITGGDKLDRANWRYITRAVPAELVPPMEVLPPGSPLDGQYHDLPACCYRFTSLTLENMARSPWKNPYATEPDSPTALPSP